MQQDSSTAPHVWLLLSNGITAILTFVTTVAALWFKRKREPAEVAKLHAETRSIHTSSDVTFGGLTLETFREIQSVIQKAEDRRAEWQAREDELRSQIRFWRNKSEELDGELIDSRDANAQLHARVTVKQDALEKAMAILHFHKHGLDQVDQEPEIKKLLDKLRAEH